MAERLIGTPYEVAIRPERIRLDGAAYVPSDGETVLAGRVREVVYLGAESRVLVDVGPGTTLTVARQNLGSSDDAALLQPGADVTLAWTAPSVLRLGSSSSNQTQEGGTA